MTIKPLLKYFCLLMVLTHSLNGRTAAKRDYYDILGLPRNALEDDIKKAYRKLAMRYHPDRPTPPGESPASAEAKFKEAKEAYEILIDPEKRQQYDNLDRAQSYANYFDEDRSTYSTSDDVIRTLRSAPFRSIDELVNLGLHILETRVRFSAQDSVQALNMKLNVAADILTRTGAMVEDRFDVMEAAYKAAFLFLQKVIPFDPSKYDYYFKYGYDYLSQTYDIVNSRPTAENLRYRQHLYRVLVFASNSKPSNCADFLTTATFTDASGNRYSIPIHIKVKLGF